MASRQMVWWLVEDLPIRPLEHQTPVWWADPALNPRRASTTTTVTVDSELDSLQPADTLPALEGYMLHLCDSIELAHRRVPRVTAHTPAPATTTSPCKWVLERAKKAAKRGLEVFRLDNASRAARRISGEERRKVRKARSEERFQERVRAWSVSSEEDWGPSRYDRDWRQVLPAVGCALM